MAIQEIFGMHIYKKTFSDVINSPATSFCGGVEKNAVVIAEHECRPNRYNVVRLLEKECIIQEVDRRMIYTWESKGKISGTLVWKGRDGSDTGS